MNESELSAAIAKGNPPPFILIGGDCEALVDRSFSAIRKALADGPPSRSLEPFPEGGDLGVLLDSFRTHSLFGGQRVLVVPELHAFVSRKEIQGLLEKALNDWKTAKTDRKRTSAMAKLLHVLGLAGVELEMGDETIAGILGMRSVESALAEMLATARATGRKVSRGEGDAALLIEAAVQGGAPGAILLMRTGEIPKDSATVDAIRRAGAVITRNLTRSEFEGVLAESIAELAAAGNVRFENQAVSLLKARLGIERLLSDKFSKDVPDLRAALNEAERLITFVGAGGKVTAAVVQEQIAEVRGGMRWELGSLFAEGKVIEAVGKLRELVAQSLREEGKANEEIHYGRFLFAIADEVRQLLGIHAWARLNNVDLRRGMQYNRFKDTLADSLGDYLKGHDLVRQKPHPFALHKRFESARNHREDALIAALDQLAELEFQRKCGGVPVAIGLETLVLGSRAR